MHVANCPWCSRIISVDYCSCGQSNDSRNPGGDNGVQGRRYGPTEIRKPADDGDRCRHDRGRKRNCRMRLVRRNATPKRQLSGRRFARLAGLQEPPDISSFAWLSVSACEQAPAARAGPAHISVVRAWPSIAGDSAARQPPCRRCPENPSRKGAARPPSQPHRRPHSGPTLRPCSDASSVTFWLFISAAMAAQSEYRSCGCTTATGCGARPAQAPHHNGDSHRHTQRTP